MRKIRASDISSYLFCQRAWKYRRKGVESENEAEMASGTTIHHKHGRSVLAAGCSRSIALSLLVVGIIFLVLHFVDRVL